MSTWKEYEKFVRDLHQALLHSEVITSVKNAGIEINKKITDNFGVEREFDIYWEYELAGITYKTVIECKDYNSKISIEKIDALIGKIRDIPDLKPIFATKVGYQSGAEIKAKHNKIDLLIVREQNESDWKDANNEPIFKYIDLNITATIPARITNIKPTIDFNWLKNTPSIDPSKPLYISELTNKIIIENIDDSTYRSLYDIENSLSISQRGKFGEHKLVEKFNNAYLIINELKIKITACEITYVIPNTITSKSTIDLSEELLGVIEYIHKNSKTLIFKSKIVKEQGKSHS
ncbi:restriction endonuclease [Yersinia sp. 2538 StPb PI]|uniref:restriction endonuclease n=1 Tax=Yersinia sp. 2538 StPb PI TaxID=3117405 RepID=UPI003FA47305